MSYGSAAVEAAGCYSLYLNFSALACLSTSSHTPNRTGIIRRLAFGPHVWGPLGNKPNVQVIPDRGLWHFLHRLLACHIRFDYHAGDRSRRDK
jgi:hypothetical protein